MNQGMTCNMLQAKEFGEAEVWMNERLMRAAPGCFAEFLTAFEAEEAPSKNNKAPEPLWLIWQYEGDYTLWDLMQKKDFPYNMEPLLLGQELDMPKGPQRKAVTISIIMQQVSCFACCAWHAHVTLYPKRTSGEAVTISIIMQQVRCFACCA